jgi:FtsZ-binding cell division protein ZapB
LNEAITALILDRLHKLPDPIIAPAELPDVDARDWAELVKERVLIRVAEPESIRDRSGNWLSVRKTDKGIFGLDESEDFPSLRKLSAADLVQYRVNLEALARAICLQNGFRQVAGKAQNGFYPLGRKTLGEIGTATVFLSFPNRDPQSVAQRLNMMADSENLKIAVFPSWASLDPSAYTEKLLYIADVETDLSINWPMSDLQSARSSEAEEYAMIYKGGRWTINYLGETIHPGSAVGLRYIAKALQRYPEALPMMEWEQDLQLTEKDQRDSGGLEARVEPNQNLEAADPKMLQQIDEAIDLLEAKITEAEEIDDTDTIQDLQGKIEDLKKRKSAISFRGRPKKLGNETMRKRLSKNLNTAFKAIDKCDARIGTFIRKTVKFRNGKLSHEPAEGESWDVRIN